MSVQVTDNGSTAYRSITGYPGPSILADGAWHQISIPNYNMGAYDAGTAATLYLQTVAGENDLVSFYIDDFQLTYNAPPSIQTNIPSIYQTLSSFFPMGVALTPTELTGAHPDLVVKHFNSVASGNDMKWDATENTKGNFNYTNADAQLDFAQCHDMLVRGHVLLWGSGNQIPSWVYGDGTNSEANKAVVRENIRSHIQNVVQHFGSRVYAWDVVNEPLDPAESGTDCLIRSPFYNVLGKEYIDLAFQTAREFAPAGTKLFLNEYSTADADRLACLVRVVQDLKGRGIPLDGVGHQMHNNINYPSVAAMVDSINTIANLNLGIEQHITEMDMSVYNAGDNTSNYGAGGGTVPPAVIAQQGYLYSQYFKAFRQLEGKLTSVTFWGIADDNTWLSSFPVSRLNTPLPFDAGLQAKPAYWAMVDPTQLPGYGLRLMVTNKTGPQNARAWTITAKNPSTGVSFTTQLNGFTLTQLSGAACTPVVTPPSAFPIVLGDIAGNDSASTAFTIDFTGCPSSARFSLGIPWSAANGAYTGTLTSGQYR
jgi:endo-1,4-beta-xylanase